MIGVDLHCHSLFSDGSLHPAHLLLLAQQQGLNTLAITDHDTLSGFQSVKSQAHHYGIHLISGVELSTEYFSQSIHVVVLGLDPENPEVQQLIEQQRLAREERNKKIALALARQGICCLIDQARQEALRLREIDFNQSLRYFANAQQENPSCQVSQEVLWEQICQVPVQLGRVHFAQALVHAEHVRNINQAFKLYLGGNKLGNLNRYWSNMADIVQQASQLGGVCILAHPFHYGLTRTKLSRLVAAFQSAGGLGIEVASHGLDRNKVQVMVAMGNEYGLYASVGSDFHSFAQPWRSLGRLAPLPKDARPIWQHLPDLFSGQSPII